MYVHRIPLVREDKRGFRDWGGMRGRGYLKDTLLGRECQLREYIVIYYDGDAIS